MSQIEDPKHNTRELPDITLPESFDITDYLCPDAGSEPLDKAKALLNEEFLRSLHEAYRALPRIDGQTVVPGGFIPQNWNGNRYQGSASINLQLRMLSHPDWSPVFFSEKQMKRCGASALLVASPSSVLHTSDGTKEMHSHSVINLSESDFAARHPELHTHIKSFFSDIRNIDSKKTVDTLIDFRNSDNRSLDDVVREMVVNSDRLRHCPRFDDASIPEQEKAILKNLSTDLAVMSICTRLHLESRISLEPVMELNTAFFSTPYPFYAAVREAGKAVIFLNRRFKLLKNHSMGVDAIMRKTKKELAITDQNKGPKI